MLETLSEEPIIFSVKRMHISLISHTPLAAHLAPQPSSHVRECTCERCQVHCLRNSRICSTYISSIQSPKMPPRDRRRCLVPALRYSTGHHCADESLNERGPHPPGLVLGQWVSQLGQPHCPCHYQDHVANYISSRTSFRNESMIGTRNKRKSE